ncbi:MAG: two-component sensor histidine kinase, partial [Cardiobacterium sp.]
MSNAVCDAFVLGLLILNLGLLNNSSLLMLSILNAVLLSAMTLTVRQSVVYGVALVVIWMMVAAFLQAVPLVPWQKMGGMPWS